MIIGFCGGTGSGKSVLVKYAYEKLGPNNSSIISLDQYYKDFSNLKFEERCNINFDHPSSIDFKLITNQLSELKNGNPVHIPIYSYKKHKRLKKTEIRYPKKFILVDGILIFSNKKLLELIDKKMNSHLWRGTSDTETLLSLVENFGIEESLNLLQGMFSFAILDTLKKNIYLCRDRYGEKPLYYGINNGVLFFGSQPKSFKFTPSFIISIFEFEK